MSFTFQPTQPPQQPTAPPGPVAPPGSVPVEMQSDPGYNPGPPMGPPAPPVYNPGIPPYNPGVPPGPPVYNPGPPAAPAPPTPVFNQATGQWELPGNPTPPGFYPTANPSAPPPVPPGYSTMPPGAPTAPPGYSQTPTWAPPGPPAAPGPAWGPPGAPPPPPPPVQWAQGPNGQWYQVQPQARQGGNLTFLCGMYPSKDPTKTSLNGGSRSPVALPNGLVIPGGVRFIVTTAKPGSNARSPYTLWVVPADR